MANIILCGGISWNGFIKPVGIYQLANILRNKGYTVQTIDSFPHIANMGVNKVIEIFDKFVNHETLWIGFSSTWFSKLADYKKAKEDPNNRLKKSDFGFVYSDSTLFLKNTFLFEDDDLYKLKKFVHSKSKNCKFVLGGGRSPIGRAGVDIDFIDCYIEGYSDNTVSDYTRFLEGKNPFLQVHKNKNNSISLIYDHKASSFDYNFHRFSWHENDLVGVEETLPMEIARGCIFNCSFCAYPLNGRRKLDYLKDPSVLRDQFEENYERFRTTRYFFLDDTFNDSVQKLEILHDKVFSKLKFKINFASYMRLDLINAHKDSIDILKEMGCKGMMFGIETLNNDSLKSIGKGITKEKIRETLTLIKEKIPESIIESQFIVGLPYESEESVRSWIEEVCHLNYPLDHVRIQALAMNYNNLYDNIWLSDFEKYPEKYGYSFINGDKIQWVNNRGLSNYRSWKIIDEMSPIISNKEGLNWLLESSLKNMGATDDQIYNNKYSDLLKLSKDLREVFMIKYIDKLCNLQT
jgi:radical SAM superfamily enzyme